MEMLVSSTVVLGIHSCCASLIKRYRVANRTHYTSRSNRLRVLEKLSKITYMRLHPINCLEALSYMTVQKTNKRYLMH